MTEKNQEMNISSWSDMEFSISGPQTVEEVLNEAILREAERRGIEKGKNQLIEQVEDEVKLHLRRYFDSILELAKIVREKVLSEYPEAHILDFRTFLLPFSDELNLFVIFDNIDFETDIKIGFLLSEIERVFLVEHNTFCEILYARKTNNLDIASVKRDYPFILKA